MAKWTTLDHSLELSESDSILCTNFEFCEGKTLSRFQEHADIQSQAIADEKTIPRKVYIF